MAISRRELIKLAPAATLGAATVGAPTLSMAQNRHRVVVVGGGFAGATAARYLARWGADRVAVTLVDPNPAHVSCVMSNLVLNGQLGVDDLAFDLRALEGRYGVAYRQGAAMALDPTNRELTLATAETLAYDSLVVTGGIDFLPPAGYDPAVMPHAWIAGEQTALLRDQLATLPDTGGTVILSIPRAPYRCPPGPYERACIIANILGSRSGTLGPYTGVAAPRLVVLDANPDIIVERDTFGAAFAELYGNIIEYHPNEEVVAVDNATLTVETAQGHSYSGDVVNVIPAHRAAAFLRDAGLTGSGNWAPVDPVTYESTLGGFQDVYVIGDSSQTTQPKSGHMANSQAKICADAILRRASGLSAFTDERLANIVTNSACYSPVSDSQASWLTAVYRYDTQTGQMGLVPGSFGASSGWSSRNYRRMFDWSNNLLADTFL